MSETAIDQPQKLQILLVECSRANAELTMAALHKPDFDPEWSCIETEAEYRQALHRNPDVILCSDDPGQFSCARALELLQHTSKDIPLILLVAALGEEQALAMIRMGAADYLLKDRMLRLGTAIQSALQARAFRRDKENSQRMLVRSERTHRQLIQMLPIPVYTTDANGYINLYNQASVALWGSKPAIGSSRWSGSTKLYDLANRPIEIADSPMAVSLRNDVPVLSYELLMERADATRHLVLSNSHPMHGTNGKVIGGVHMLVDITKHKRTELELRRSEESYRELFECASDAILICSPTGLALDINLAGCEIADRSRQEILGKPILDFVVLEDRRRLMENFGNTSKLENYYPEYRVDRKDGVELHVELNMKLLPDHRLLVIARNITDRKLAALKIQEQAQILDRASNAIVVCTLEGRVTFWNQGAETIFGWTAAETLGQRTTDIFGDKALINSEKAMESLERDDEWCGEHRSRNKQGEQLILNFSATNIRDDQGLIIYRLVIATDITEKSRLEEQFLRVQRLDNIGMLAAGIAHDLNNVLAPVCMIPVLLRNSVSKQRDLNMLDILEKSAARGAGLVRQILTFAQGNEAEIGEVQVKHLLQDTAAVIDETFPKSITFEEVIPKDLWPVLGNPSHIHQVVLNLCVNARDAMQGEGTLKLKAENLVMDAAHAQSIPGARPGPWIVISVEDSGTGISPDVLPRIWEPFFSTKSKANGTGLGLATVRGIVEKHRGAITVATEVNSGTCFRVYLPSCLDLVLDSVDVCDSIPSRGNDQLILVVDDEDSIRTTISEILLKQGYRVLCAADGAEALSLAAGVTGGIDLLVTDMDMPKLNGSELMLAMREIDPAQRILAMSGNTSEFILENGDASSAANAVIAKPFAVNSFLNAVDRVLAG